jgi:DMSO/TMAO reductase YedYZ molybdopterin-dependent catalytic subunit
MVSAKFTSIMLKMRRFTHTGKTHFTNRIGRREFLFAGLVSGGGLLSERLLGQGRFLPGRTAASARSQAEPEVTELRTPNIDFFIRNHFTTPRINAETWNLDIGGLVSSPMRLSYSDLLLMASLRRAFTIECAGNPAGGPGVSTALWSGVPLAELLKQAGLRTEARSVVFYGADSGGGEDVPTGTHFARAIPLEKAMDPLMLLAYEMNGEPLPADHGFPLRAVVPGWYGMDSVKWLMRVAVLGQPFEGYFQTQEYMAVTAKGGRQPVTRMQVNSKFFRPSEGEEIRLKTYKVNGVAWAGDRKVTKVEVRVDVDGTWQPANLAGVPEAMVWTPWSYDWNIAHTGAYTLEVRATDDESRTQPDVRDPGRKDFYELNTPARITVNVRQ